MRVSELFEAEEKDIGKYAKSRTTLEAMEESTIAKSVEDMITSTLGKPTSKNGNSISWKIGKTTSLVLDSSKEDKPVWHVMIHRVIGTHHQGSTSVRDFFRSLEAMTWELTKQYTRFEENDVVEDLEKLSNVKYKR